MRHKISLEQIKSHLCDSCSKQNDIPNCKTDDGLEPSISYGMANGFDNVVECDAYGEGF